MACLYFCVLWMTHSLINLDVCKKIGNSRDLHEAGGRSCMQRTAPGLARKVGQAAIAEQTDSEHVTTSSSDDGSPCPFLVVYTFLPDLG